MTIRDQFNDPALGHLTRILTEMPSLENFVKTASMDASEAAARPADAFAWPEERRFPIDSPEMAALSAAYAKTASENIPGFVSESIKKALEVYGVPEAVFETAKVAAREERLEDWLCGDLKLFQVKEAADIAPAQHAFLENYEKLDVPHRKMAAENLVKKAVEFKVDVRPHVTKVAGMTVSHIPTLRKWVHAREDASPKAEHKQAYAKFAADLRRMPEESADSHALMKIATALTELDARAGIDKHYDRRLPDPMLTVFNTDKLASESIDIDGMQVSAKKLMALPESFWKDLGGQDLADEIMPKGSASLQKLKTVVATLPMDLKRVIKAQMR